MKTILITDSAGFIGSSLVKRLFKDLVYTEEYEDEHEARMREQQLHKWSRAKKEALIRGDKEALKSLSKAKGLLH